MPSCVFLLLYFLTSAFKLIQCRLEIDGSRGLGRGILIHGSQDRVSYGNFAVDKFHRLRIPACSSSVVSNYRECALLCLNNPLCYSFNVASSPRLDGKFLCELLSKDKYTASPSQLVESQEYHHYRIKTLCSSFPCQNNATCVTDYSKNQYHCDCVPGYKGILCETDIDECASNPCLNGATCVDKVNSYVCNCQAGYLGVHCQTALKSCKEVYNTHNSPSQLETIIVDGQQTSVFCHMGNFGCGNGGWTTVIKMDGNKNTFKNTVGYWTNKNHYNLPGGETGFDTQETKLPTYWNTPFSKICLGMKIGNQKKFIVINKQANSLYSLIADGQYRSTSLARSSWRALIGSQSSLQQNCNKQGFNVQAGNRRIRIGLFANNENDCDTADSWIGFGTNEAGHTCGNRARWGGDNGEKDIKAMGYILIQ